MTHTSMKQPEALPTPDAVMEQAQVFASAWALCGSGSILEPANSREQAEEAKNELAQMVRRLHARVQELEAGLKKANAQAEHFEREWYLRGDELEAAQAQRAPLTDSRVVKHISALTEILRMPNAEYVADAHNEAVRYLRGITQEKQG